MGSYDEQLFPSPTQHIVSDDALSRFPNAIIP